MTHNDFATEKCVEFFPFIPSVILLHLSLFHGQTCMKHIGSYKAVASPPKISSKIFIVDNLL